MGKNELPSTSRSRQPETELARRLVAEADRRGWTISDFARHAQEQSDEMGQRRTITIQQAHRWLTVARSLSGRNRDLLCELLGVSAEYLTPEVDL